MTIVLVGASGSGKSTIESELATHFGYRKIVSYTTRAPREYEQSGKDYYFVDREMFEELLNKGLLAESDEYSQGRLYGTLRADYSDGDRVVVLTPNGLRELRKNCNDDIFAVLVKADLGTRVIRYIQRCGVDKFSYDDKNEISSRTERDFGMFLGIEREIDMVVQNNDGDDIGVIAQSIVDAVERRKRERSYD